MMHLYLFFDQAGSKMFATHPQCRKISAQSEEERFTRRENNRGNSREEEEKTRNLFFSAVSALSLRLISSVRVNGYAESNVRLTIGCQCRFVQQCQLQCTTIGT
jgi:hypothetical protein